MSINDAVSRLQRFENIGLICDIIVEDGLTQFNNGEQKTPQISFFIEKSIYDLRNSHPEIIKAYKDFEATIRMMGYFIANTKVKEEQGDDGQIYDVVYMTIHPKYIIEVTDRVYGMKIDGILYHITQNKNWKSIEEKGFIPRNSHVYDDNYPDRVYFFTKLPPDGFKKTVENFAEYAKQDMRRRLEKARQQYWDGDMTKYTYDILVSHRYDYREWVVVKVDLKDKRTYVEDDRTTKYRFFNDPRSINGIFTYENIDPLCLTYHSSVRLENDTDDLDEFLNPVKPVS